MATVDMTQRKLLFPPRFVPYLEKHRIFELFHECVELLVQFRPRDHIQFLKTVLPCAARKKDKQRIVFLTPPSFDRVTFGKALANCLGIQAIDRNYIKSLTSKKLEKDEIKVPEIEICEEEESCLYEEAGEIHSLFYHSGEGIPYYLDIEGEKEVGQEKEEEEEEEGEGGRKLGRRGGKKEKKEEKSCICVCPCVELKKKKKKKKSKKEEENKNELEESKGEKDGDGDGYDGNDNKDDEGEKGSWEGENKETEEEAEEEEEEEEEEGGEGGGEGGEREGNEEKPKKKKKKGHRVCKSTSGNNVEYGILGECNFAANGWILIDFPTSVREAEELCALGILPTHAIRIIVNEEEESRNRQYKWFAVNWMKVYRFVPPVEIRVNKRTFEQLTVDMCRFLSVMPHRHAPMLPRIVLIGSRGSGVTTQGEKLSKKYGFVHVEFEIVKARALQQSDEIATLYKRQLATRPDPELEAFILEKALMTSACRNRGWVLTGYPRNIDEMRMLDITATPPNRIIFIEVPPRECFVRLYYRKTDSCLGDEYKLPAIEPFGLESYTTSDIDPDVAERLKTHPKNDKRQIIHDIEQYFYDKQAMMSYCGRTASYVDGNKTVDNVCELIEQIIINPSAAQPPRNPLEINHGIAESYKRLKKYRLTSGMYYNNFFLNPPEQVVRF